MEEKKVAKKKVANKRKSDKPAQIEAESENAQFAEYVTANVMELFNSLKQGLNKLNKSNQSLKEQIVQQQAASQHEQPEPVSKNAEYVTADVMEHLNSLKQGLDQLDKSNQSLKEQIVQQQAASQHEQSEAESEHIQYTEYLAANVLEPLNSLKQGLDQLDKSNQSLKEQIAQQQAASHRQNPLLKIIVILLGIGIITIGYSSININSRMNESIGIDLNDMNSYEIGYTFGIKIAKLLPGIDLNEMVSGMCDILSEVDTSLINAGVCPDQSATADNQAHASTSALPPLPATANDQAQANISALPPLPTPPGAFMEDVAAPNTMSQGVTTLPSGVQYEVLKAGSGAQPQAGDEVVISYRTYLDDGTVFGSTGNDGESRQIALDEIKVPGLKEALLLMNAGSRWKVTVPPNMGFTKSGNRTLRRANLTYDIVLISVEQG